MIYNFAQSYFALLLKLGDVNKKSFLYVLLIDENKSPAFFRTYSGVMSKFVIVNTHVTVFGIYILVKIYCESDIMIFEFYLENLRLF